MTVELRALSSADDFRVPANECDPRGWHVTDANNVDIGDVADLIIDVEALLARYIEVSITRGNARRILIPTGFVRLDPERSVVHLDFVTAADVEQLPTFTSLPLAERDSAQIEKVLTGVNPHVAAPAKIVRRAETVDQAS
jgi:hypothetical protein